MNRHPVASLVMAVALGVAAFASAAPTTASPAKADSLARNILVVRLEGAVSPVMDEMLARALARAAREEAAALVIEVDTPGGLESSMRTMCGRILASERPVIAYVTPSGAHAASAGVFIVMAANVAAMSPGTNIGAATPIHMQGPMDSTLARKATNDAAAFARTVAAMRGRNVAWAEDAVRRAVSVSETEAVRDSVVDFVAGDLPDLLARADGRTWHRAAAFGPIVTRGVPVVRIEPDFRQRLLGRLADPNIAYLLMMLGFYGLIFELQNPGSILPGIVGGICLVLALFSLSTLPVTSAGIALLLLGGAFLLAEVKVQSHGLLTAGGAIALALGGLMLFQPNTVRVALPVILGATAMTVAFFLFVIGAAVRARSLPVTTGAAGMRGKRGTALERLAPAGRVKVGDETWDATAAATVEPGESIEVIRAEGLMLHVRRKAED
ncbi:MAG: nodulation protein NfeD [Candidatus Eisenbacteria bacterium]|nr:nodulation protein NfeD [Candidatus Eisenbacteria bacterium]